MTDFWGRLMGWKKPNQPPPMGSRVPMTGNGYTGGKKPKKVKTVVVVKAGRHRK